MEEEQVGIPWVWAIQVSILCGLKQLVVAAVVVAAVAVAVSIVVVVVGVLHTVVCRLGMLTFCDCDEGNE